MSNSFAGQNIRYLRKLRGWTQDAFAERLQIKRSLLGAYEEARAEPKFEVLTAVTNLFKLSLDDLLLTDLSQSAKSSPSYLDRRRAMKLTDDARNEIEFVPVKAHAGYLSGYADPEFIDELNTFTLPMLGNGHFRAFEIVGDSMLPTTSGSIIVGQKVDSLTDVKFSNAYIVVSKNGGVVYKRIRKNNRAKDQLTLVSDNTIYEPYPIEAREILELWKAQFIIAKAERQQQWDVNQLANLVTDLQQQVHTLNKKVEN